MATQTISNKFNQQDQYLQTDQKQQLKDVSPSTILSNQADILKHKDNVAKQKNELMMPEVKTQQDLSTQVKRIQLQIIKSFLGSVILYVLVVVLFIWVVLLQVKMDKNLNLESIPESNQISQFQSQNSEVERLKIQGDTQSQIIAILQSELKKQNELISQLTSRFNILLNNSTQYIDQQDSYNKKASQAFDQIKTDFAIQLKQLTSLLNNIQNSVSSSIESQKKQVGDLKNEITSQKSNIENLQSNSKDISSIMDSVVKSIPQTILYGPYLTKTDNSNFFPVLNQINIHQTDLANITIKKKSLVTLTANGHMISNQQHFNVFFMKNKEPIPQKIAQAQYYDSYLYAQDNVWASMNFSQNVILEPGTYLFEIGSSCYNQFNGSQFAFINLIGFTVKVQELTQS